MNKVLAALIVSLAFLTGCPGPVTPNDVNVTTLNGNVARPETTYSLLAAFTAALPCDGQPLVWSISEASVGVWTPAIDGSITQTGLWTSPACGSVWLGQQLHINAYCASTNQTATAIIATVPEQVTDVAIMYAVVTNLGQASCLAPNPLAPTVQPGGSIQFYARVLTTCGEVVTPTPPATWPTTCQ